MPYLAHGTTLLAGLRIYKLMTQAKLCGGNGLARKTAISRKPWLSCNKTMVAGLNY
jgi:hypothetical protein